MAKLTIMSTIPQASTWLCHNECEREVEEVEEVEDECGAKGCTVRSVASICASEARPMKPRLSAKSPA